MENALIVVGNNIKYNAAFMAYLERSVREKIGHLDAIYHLDKNDNNLFLTLEEIILRSKYVVVATRDAYSLVGKILCTLSQDHMVVKEDVLAPSRALKYDHDSYLLKYEKSLINVIKIHEKEILAPIMIEREESIVSFYLIDAVSDQYQEILENISKIHDVTLSQTSLIDGLVFVRASGFLHAQYEGFIQALAFGFRDHIVFGEDLGAIVTERLIEAEKKVSCAESCTGGLIASEIVKHAGVSAIFEGSVVSYSNEMKCQLLGVKELTLSTYGAVSVQTVYEMLEGALKISKSPMAIAVSGIAGPGGGSKDKPVGTVCIGAKTRGEEAFVEKLHFKGDREYIQQQAILWGFKLLIQSDKKTFLNFFPKKLDN